MSPEDDTGRFRLALIGAGRMGRAHLQAIQDSKTVRVTAVVDPRPDALVAAGGAAGVVAYAELDELLDAGGVDGALVAAPTDLHLDIVRRLVAQEIPVLCEKPCGLTVAEAEACAQAAADAGVVLRVAYWRRFVPVLAELRARVAAGELGDLLAVNCYQWDREPPPEEFRDRSGGILVDMGVHEFDQVRWLTGQELRTLDVAASRLGPPPGDPDCAQLVATLDGGATAMISLGRWHPSGDSCKVEVFGTTGTVSSWFLRPDEGDAVFHEALRLQAEGFAAEVTADGAATDSGSSVADAIAALRLAEVATERLGGGAPIPISDRAASAAPTAGRSLP